MKSTTKSQTSIAKFEEFFATSYKDDVFEILETYPDNRSLTVDYTTLEVFDPDLADLLIEKPEEVIEAAQIAVKNIDPLAKDADLNIRFKNVTNIIPLKILLSKYIGSFVAAEGIVRKTDEIRPRIETAVFECRGCMRLHEVEQTSDRTILEPSLCGECGGRFTHTIRRRGNDKKHYENWSCIDKIRYGSSGKDKKNEKFGCDNVNIQYQDLKEILTHIACDIMRDKSEIADQVISIVSSVLKSSMENSRVSYYERQLDTIEKKKQKLLDMCLSGDIETDEYKKGFERLNNEYKETNIKLKDEKDRHALAENQSSIIESIREYIQGIVVNGCWDEIFYGNLVERIEVFNDRSLNIHLNLMPKTCCAKVLKGKEINEQNAQELRAKSAFCTYRGSSVPMSVNVAFSSGSGIANRCDR